MLLSNPVPIPSKVVHAAWALHPLKVFSFTSERLEVVKGRPFLKALVHWEFLLQLWTFEFLSFYFDVVSLMDG